MGKYLCDVAELLLNRFIARTYEKYEVRNDLTIFKGCHFARCYILISSSFRKIKTKNFRSNPCFFKLAKMGTSPVEIYLLKLINSYTITSCEICSIVTTKTQEPCQWRRSCVFIVNFEQISRFIFLFLFSTRASILSR